MKRELEDANSPVFPAKKQKSGVKNWTPEESETFFQALEKFGKGWNAIGSYMREKGFEARNSGLYNSKYQTYAFNQWWAGNDLKGALAGKGHTISGSQLDPYGGKSWQKMANARFEVLKGGEEVMVCKLRMIRERETKEGVPIVLQENEAELKFAMKENIWSFEFEGVSYSTQGGVTKGLPRNETWQTESDAAVTLQLRDSGRIRGKGRVRTNGAKRGPRVRLPKASRSVAELRERTDVKVEYEVSPPRNVNREKDKCILGVSVVVPSEGNLGKDQQKLPHLVFRQQNLRVSAMHKHALESVLENLMSSSNQLLSGEFSSTNQINDFLWDFTVTKDRKLYDKYIVEDAECLKDWLVSECNKLKDGKSHQILRGSIVPLKLDGKVLSMSDAKDSNVQVTISCQRLDAPFATENSRRATQALEILEARPKLEETLTMASLQGKWLSQVTGKDNIEKIVVKGDQVTIGEDVKQIVQHDSHFQLHTWKLQRVKNAAGECPKLAALGIMEPQSSVAEASDNNTETVVVKGDQVMIGEDVKQIVQQIPTFRDSKCVTWIHQTKKGKAELTWTRETLTVPILAEERINFRIEIQYAKKDQPWILEEHNMILNTFASMLQSRLKEIFYEFNKSSTNMPVYMSHVRDNFTHELHGVQTKMGNTIKIDWYLDVERALPSKYADMGTQEQCRKEKYVHSGIVTYDDAFSNKELKQLEDDCEETLHMAFDGKFLKNTAQSDPHEGTGPKDRTKFFFNLRYNWRDFEMKEPDANFAAGIRSDVSPIQPWMKMPTQRMKDLDIIQDTEWINQISFNDYSSASMGLGPHFDDAARFSRPITTIRLFSDSRLAFELRYYGINMGSMIIPLPRGRICVLLKGSYAAEYAKHAVRDSDVTERSAALILRHVHDDVVQKAREFQKRKEEEALNPPEPEKDAAMEERAENADVQMEEAQETDDVGAPDGSDDELFDELDVGFKVGTEPCPKVEVKVKQQKHHAQPPPLEVNDG